MTNNLQSKVSSTKPSRWFRVNLWLHRWVSLVATLPFLILCLTGTILIFHEEIDIAMGVIPPAPGLTNIERPLSESVDNVLTAYPNEKVVLLGIDPKEHPGLLLLATTPIEDDGIDNVTFRFAHLATGELASKGIADHQTLTGFLYKFHAQWFLGAVGQVIGAFIALLVLISLVSGLVVYGPYARRIAYGALRRGRSARLLQLDLHHYIGTIVLGWMFVVTITGFLLGFGSVATAIWSKGQLAQVQQQYVGPEVDNRNPSVSVDEVYTVARAAAPSGWTVTAVIWPKTPFSTNSHYSAMINGSGLDEKVFRLVFIDAETGVVAEVAELPWYMKAIVLSQPLHFGDYGGMPLKILWTLCTWLTLFITANGAWLWWSRRKPRVTS